MVRKPEARLVQWLHLLGRFIRPPHTAKRGFFIPALSPTIGHRLGERALIDRIAARVGAPRRLRPARHRRRRRGARPGAGRGRGRHNRRARRRRAFPPRVVVRLTIGYKALAVNLSDLAAMGATPRASLLSLALPDDFPLEDFDGLDRRLSGARSRVGRRAGRRQPDPLARAGRHRRHGHRVRPADARLLRRAGARAGDDLYVTGWLGPRRPGLAMLEAGIERSRLEKSTSVRRAIRAARRRDGAAATPWPATEPRRRPWTCPTAWPTAPAGWRTPAASALWSRLSWFRIQPGVTEWGPAFRQDRTRAGTNRGRGLRAGDGRPAAATLTISRGCTKAWCAACGAGWPIRGRGGGLARGARGIASAALWLHSFLGVVPQRPWRPPTAGFQPAGPGFSVGRWQYPTAHRPMSAGTITVTC